MPTRYLHSHTGVIARSDVEQAIRLVTEIVRRIDEDTLATLRDFS